MPSATSRSRAASAALRVSYIAVRMRSAIDGSSFLKTGLVRAAALEPLDLGPLRAERHRFAHGLGAAPLGDPDLLLEDQLGGDHEPLLKHGDDQHPVLLTHHRRRLDRSADRHALDDHVLLAEGDLGELLALLDARADHHPAALDLALADLDPLLDELEALGPLVLGHRRPSPLSAVEPPLGGDGSPPAPGWAAVPRCFPSGSGRQQLVRGPHPGNATDGGAARGAPSTSIEGDGAGSGSPVPCP